MKFYFFGWALKHQVGSLKALTALTTYCINVRHSLKLKPKLSPNPIFFLLKKKKNRNNNKFSVFLLTYFSIKNNYAPLTKTNQYSWQF